MKKIAVVLLLLVLAALGMWLGRPAYRAHKEQRFASRARLALAKNETRPALLNAQQALIINSNNLTACEVMAELADASRSPHALMWRRRVAELQPSIENRLAFAACALRYEQPPFPIAGEMLRALSDEAQQSVQFQVVSAQFALRQNRMVEAARHFENAIRLEPTNQLHQLNLAVVRLESKDSAATAQAHRDLEKLQASATLGPAALRALIVHHTGRKQFTEAQSYSTTLLQSPRATFGDRLEHFVVLHGAKDASFRTFLAQTQREAATNAVMAADLVTRLSGLGLGGEAITWTKTLSPERRSELPLPMAIADSLAGLGRWREMEEFLTPQRWRERDFLRQALLSYALRNQKVSDVALVHWNDAVRQASARSELLGLLAPLAAAWGWTNEAETVLWRAARQFPKEHWPLESLQTFYVRTKSARGLYDVNTLLLDRQPSNPIVQNNWATLGLLLQTNTAKAHEFAKQVYAKGTNNSGFVSTHAWSLHLQGQTAAGLKIIETLPAADLENTAVAGYYGLLLAAAGQKEKARRYLSSVEKIPMLPEESKLFADALKGL
jgi:tetratricopeptide (TPR) repeat protein